MAFEYYNAETGESGIAGNPSREEIAAGKAKDERDRGKISSFEELYGDER